MNEKRSKGESGVFPSNFKKIQRNNNPLINTRVFDIMIQQKRHDTPKLSMIYI